MKKLSIIVLILLIATSLYACQDEPTEPIPTEPTILDTLAEAYPEQDVYYHIFVRSFADSDGDGIGDLKGITNNLDYLAELGITALWLMPINPSPSYHGYSVTDYYGIEEDYGTMEDFNELISEAKNRGIDIIIDLVINHTSDQHPWYISARSSTSDPYRDYYIWNGSTAYESFVGGMKDLNFKNPEVIDEVKNIMDYWLDLGVTGFRIDAAMHLIESVNPTYDNSILLLNLNAHIKRNYPHSFVVSEVFNYNIDQVADYYIGSDSLFNFYQAQNVWDKLGNGNSRFLFVNNLNRAYNAFRAVDDAFIDSPFLSNHDVDRIASMGGFSQYNGDLKLALAARILLTLPGNPFIYYGDELGMKGVRYEGLNVSGYGVVYDEYRRQPFLWGDQAITTTWLPSDGSNDQTPSVLTQKTDENSLYNAYRDIIQIRRSYPALMYGNSFIPYSGNNSNIQGYIRTFTYDDFSQAILVIHNFSPDPLSLDVEYVTSIYGSVDLPAYGTFIAEIDYNLIEAYQ